MCTATSAGAEFDFGGTSGCKIAQKEKAAKESAAREHAWLRRGAKTSASLWKPKKFHRLQAMRWLCSLDHQFKLITSHKGLVHFKHDGNDPARLDWRTWPFACIGLDLGSDGCSGLHGAMYFDEWVLNVDGMQDHSHGGNRNIYKSLKQCDLYGLVLLGVVGFNVALWA